MTRRVVITGMGALTPIGNDWPTMRANLEAGRNGVEFCPQWADLEGLVTRLGAPVDFETPKRYPRKKTRSMGRVSCLATRATEIALEDGGLLGSPLVSDGGMGISYGSTSGSADAMTSYVKSVLADRTLKGVTPSDYVRLMSHTCAANLGQFFQIRGRVIPTCSACTSGSQGVGYGYEAVRFGKQTLMVAGGAEELHVIDAAVFDVMYATSTKNDTPKTTPRPFDRDRDGLVVGEGAGTLLLEDLEHAIARGAKIYAEVVGYGTNCDGKHVTNPSQDGMAAVMAQALEDAGIAPEQIDYVNAHGTSTEVGDIAESGATHAVFGDRMPISSLKSYVGHTLGACGAVEAFMTVHMQRESSFAPTVNLENVDERCAPLDYIMGGMRAIDAEYVMSNNFAFGGVNTSLIFRRYTGEGARA